MQIELRNATKRLFKFSINTKTNRYDFFNRKIQITRY